MINQYDKIALCSHVQQGKVRYYKEYTLNGRIVGTECIPYPNCRLLNNGANNRRCKTNDEI